MALDWKQLALEEPVDGVDLWIRVYWYQGTPVEAQYNSTNQEFITNLLGIVFPAWAVARWAYPAGYTPVTNEPEVEQYIDGLSTPLSSEMIDILNTFVAGLKTDLAIDTLDERFDTFYWLQAETLESALRNLVKNLSYATAINSPTFTQYVGISGNGSTQYIETNYTFGTDNVNFIKNDACHAVGLGAGTIAGSFDHTCGVYTGTYEVSMAIGSSGNPTYHSCNSAAGYNGSNNGSAPGNYYAGRTTGTIRGWKDGSSVLNHSQTAIDIETIEDYIMLDNGISGGGYTGYFTFRFTGSYFSDAEIALIDGRIDDYITAINLL